MSENLALRVSAKVVIEAEGCILALHPSGIDLNRKWHIPGGIRDDIMEPLRQTGVREVHEETGLDISGAMMTPFKVGEWAAVDKGEKVRILAVFFHLIMAKRPKVILEHEHDDFTWLTRDNYGEYDTNPEVQEIIDELL